MKNFLIGSGVVAVLYLFGWYLVFYEGFFIDLNQDAPVTVFVKTADKEIKLKKEDDFESFIIKGVDMDASIPGYFATNFKIDKKTYLRWFAQIQEMGGNTIRVYTIMNDVFYNAFYEYNMGREEPLYLMQGLWVTDYVNNSSGDAFGEQFYGSLEQDAVNAVDIIHGRKNLPTNKVRGSGSYRKDISQWVLGYILGLDFKADTIEYTNHLRKEEAGYAGEYVYTTEDATPFETMLSKVIDRVISYESNKYKTQRLVSFANEPNTDPFEYEYDVATQIVKFTHLDGEHIKMTDKVQSGFFASYRLYEYCPDFTKYLSESEKTRLKDILPKLDSNAPYEGYVQLLHEYHTIPVVIAGYGFSTARGVDGEISIKGRKSLSLREEEQGEALVETFEHIIKSGISGAFITSWQDVWTQRTANTMYAVEINHAMEWSDYQTSDQFYGLLSFDPGKGKSICYVDGDVSEWETSDLVVENEELKLSMKYDEKFVYFMIDTSKVSLSDVLYIPIDVTPKSGSNYCEEYDIKFAREADFILCLDDLYNSRLLVQERYEAFREAYLYDLEGIDPFVRVPSVTTPIYNPIKMIISENVIDENLYDSDVIGKKEFRTAETGRLTYGNANPNSPKYNSLADIIRTDSNIEIRIPWQLLNFSAPSRMKVHDDYYLNYGVESIKIDKIFVGISKKEQSEERIPMMPFGMKGWGKNPAYHERLKKSYEIVKNYWNKE